MFNMFSVYYKTKLKNKLKNKSQQKISFTNSRCSLSIPSRSTHSVLSPSFHDLLTMKLSLSPYLCRSHNSELSAFSVQICSFSVCPSRLLHFISGVVAASLDRRRYFTRSPSLPLHLRRCWCAISLQPLLPEKPKEEPKKEEPKKKEEAKKEEPKKEEPKKEEEKKEEEKKQEAILALIPPPDPVLEVVKAYRAYNPYLTTHYHVQSIEENPNACVIC